jgi:hypothetical protein
MDTPPFQYTQTTDGVRIAYRILPGTAPPIVMPPLTQGPTMALGA